MKRISVEIDENTMSELNAIVKKGMRTVREVTHARILLLTHSGRRSNEIAEILKIDTKDHSFDLLQLFMHLRYSVVR